MRTDNLYSSLRHRLTTRTQELLVATRAIFYTEFRGAFVKHLDLLLDESVVVGPGITQRDALR